MCRYDSACICRWVCNSSLIDSCTWMCHCWPTIIDIRGQKMKPRRSASSDGWYWWMAGESSKLVLSVRLDDVPIESKQWFKCSNRQVVYMDIINMSGSRRTVSVDNWSIQESLKQLLPTMLKKLTQKILHHWFHKLAWSWGCICVVCLRQKMVYRRRRVNKYWYIKNIFSERLRRGNIHRKGMNPSLLSPSFGKYRIILGSLTKIDWLST